MSHQGAAGLGLDDLVSEDSDLRLLCTAATWSEGPVWMPTRGVLRWSDIPGNRILEADGATGHVTVYLDDAEYPNGRALADDGTVVQCSHGRRAVESDRNGVITTLVERWNGRRFNSPNDVVVARDGRIWFTDPPYGIIQPHEGHPGVPEYGGNFVFRFDPASGSVDAVVTDIEEPNGLAFSPDESILYVSDTSAALRADGTGNHHIRSYRVEDERCVDGRVFAVIEPGVSDGFRVDERGNIWTSSADAVQVYAPDGSLLGRIPVPECVGNLCFGGEDGRTLFIAATTSIYTIETLVRDARSVAAAS